LVQTQKRVLKGELQTWRTKNQARVEGTLQLKDSICFKSVQIWFLGNWTLDPCLKLALDKKDYNHNPSQNDDEIVVEK
jgi:hypothetical protein